MRYLTALLALTNLTMLYLSQESQMLNNQMSALCFPGTTLPTDDDTLKQKENNVLTKTSRRDNYVTFLVTIEGLHQPYKKKGGCTQKKAVFPSI